MNSNAITYLASGILGVALGVGTLLGAGATQMEVACDIVDCRSVERVLPCPSNNPACDNRSVEMHLACDSKDGCDDRVAPCDPDSGVDCLESEAEILLACPADDCPVQPDDDDILLAGDGDDGGNGGGRSVPPSIAPCDLSDPDCDDRPTPATQLLSQRVVS